MKYQNLAEEFIKEKLIKGPAAWDVALVEDFARWLDSQQKTHPRDKCEMAGCKKCDYTELDFQQKSGGKKKIEKLYGIFRKIIVGKEVFYGLTKDGADKLLDKLNELVKAHNENL